MLNVESNFSHRLRVKGLAIYNILIQGKTPGVGHTAGPWGLHERLRQPHLRLLQHDSSKVSCELLRAVLEGKAFAGVRNGFGSAAATTCLLRRKRPA